MIYYFHTSTVLFRLYCTVTLSDYGNAIAIVSDLLKQCYKVIDPSSRLLGGYRADKPWLKSVSASLWKQHIIRNNYTICGCYAFIDYVFASAY